MEGSKTKMTTTVLDTSGMRCPLPVLKAKKAITALKPGEVLEIIATDPGSVLDFEVFCSVSGHKLLRHSQAGDVYRFEIQRV